MPDDGCAYHYRLHHYPMYTCRALRYVYPEVGNFNLPQHRQYIVDPQFVALIYEVAEVNTLGGPPVCFLSMCFGH